MKLFPIVYADLISASIVLYVWIRIYANPTLETKAVHLFRNIGSTIFVTLVLDHIWEYFYEISDLSKASRHLLNTISSLEFLCIPVIFFFLLMYHRDQWDLGDTLALAADAGLLILNLLNIWIPTYAKTTKGLYMVNAPAAKWIYPGIVLLFCFILTHDILLSHDIDVENRIMVIFTALIAALGSAGCYFDGDVVSVWECVSIVYLLLFLTFVRIFDKTDQVTGIPNRNAFTLAFFRKKKKLAPVLVSFDLNHLKNFNDNMGHSTGDQYLFAFAMTAQKELKPYGKLYRVGGDEFCLISYDDPKGIQAVIDRLQEMERSNSAFGDFPLDFAYGIAIRSEGESNEALYKRADALMYENKRKSESGQARM
ncbi:GGDEF domain-containing protein [Lachnospiraceae bacterium YH-ros2226]